VLHRDNLPRAVARDHLRALTADTNAVLGDFLAPFRVEAEDDLSFRADFHDGRSQPAGRLSGGEKVVLAVGFRLSVNSVFAQDVGLLCLDEPTVGLDEHNLGCLRTALGRLRDLSRARGLQVILVTHERSLMPLFDKVIDLDAGP
jgi:DNA repair exonuclease SbcCD ATPase subunit